MKLLKGMNNWTKAEIRLFKKLSSPIKIQHYLNAIGQKTMRSHSILLDLSQFDKRDWMTTDEDLEYIGDKLDEIKHIPVMDPAMIRSLNPADKDLVKAGLLGAKKEGLYKPKK